LHLAKVNSRGYKPKFFSATPPNSSYLQKRIGVKIAVNTRLVIKDKMDGIGWFTLETMSRIANSHTEHQFWFLFDRPPSPALQFPPNVKPVVVRPVTRLPLLLKFWNNVAVPFALSKIKPDLYISSDGFLPPSIRIPSIAVIHDLNFEHHPHFLPSKYSGFYKSRMRKSAEMATLILTVSAYSKSDLVSTYGISPDKIDVVYCGLNSFIKPISPEEIRLIHQHLGIRGDYFIVVGTLHPRKNIPATIEAYNTFRSRTGKQVQLVFAGNDKWTTPEIKDAFGKSTFHDDILVTGRVSDHVMNALVTGATAMVYVSLFEGFGMPILEAAAAGVPVITSNNTSMKEIAGDTALLVDPLNTNQIAEAMHQIIAERDLADQLIERSKTLPGKYSWDQSAERIWQSILKVVHLTSHDDTTPHGES
jgi:glycosyltransferase involved in cell wall biosynthesis